VLDGMIGGQLTGPRFPIQRLGNIWFKVFHTLRA